MYFPLRKKKINFNLSETNFLESYDESTEIPLLPHPGAFSKVRRNHQHEGIDLYCNKGDEVICMEDGVIIDIYQFTGEYVCSEWWNDTWAVLVKTASGVFNYGELVPETNLKKGQIVKEGTVLGKITPVLKKDKGRPMSMLHLEMYEHGTINAITEWPLNTTKPPQLLNPTQFLINIALKNSLFCELKVLNNINVVHLEE